MAYKRILTIQDISCVGQCSITVALPVLSACGIETAILPTAVLSNHTGGFQGFTFRDLAGDLEAIADQWQANGIVFDAVYTGYLGAGVEVEGILRLLEKCLSADGKVIVDPVMADHGRLYAGFGKDYPRAQEALCQRADYLLPNVTEACLLSGEKYRENVDETYIASLLDALHARFPGTMILTGVGFAENETGVMVSGGGERYHYRHARMPRSSHGTGDVFASVFTGALLRGLTPLRAVKIAADFVVECLRETEKNPEHWYGVYFEPLLPRLMARLEAESGDRE